MVVKNCPNDAWLNCTPIATLEDYMKATYLLIEENYDLIKKDDLFE
jgi:hypothetical protein